MKFEIAIRASQGQRRGQEDTALAWPQPDAASDSVSLMPLPATIVGQAAAVLCDGMGGHVGGGMASRLACEAFLPDVARATGDVRDHLFDALNLANAALAAKIASNTEFTGMGSTLVGVYLTADGLSWISVGDSLLYLWRRGKAVLLNEDHSLAPEIDKLAESGKITWAAAEADPRRHYLRSALTGDEIEMIDLSERAIPLQNGDVVVLASDGIHTLKIQHIAEIISATHADGAPAIAARLISTVDAAHVPHQDNTTVVVICVRGDATRRPQSPHAPGHV